MFQDSSSNESVNEKSDLKKSSTVATRVADVHHQTRQGLFVGLAFVVVAVATGIFQIGSGWWLSLHLFVVGGLLSAISAVTQMLAVTWSSSPAPSKATANIQRWMLALGTVAMVHGRENASERLFEIGATLVCLSMLVLAVILIRIRKQASTPRFSPAIESYVIAVFAGIFGMLIGVMLGGGYGTSKAYELRQVHIVLNIYGLIGLIVAGTLPFFVATQVRSKMSKRATPTTMRATLFVLSIATLLAVIGYLFEQVVVGSIGLFLYALGLLVTLYILPIYSKSRLDWAGPRILQLVTGILWWAGLTGVLAITTILKANNEIVLQALVIGGFAQILVASLAYLGPVLVGGGHKNLTKGFSITRSWISLSAGNLAALATVLNQKYVVCMLLVIWLVDVLVRAVLLMQLKRTDNNV